MCGEERKAEGESRRGEDGESLDEDVGDDLGLEEVRVELVAIASSATGSCMLYSLRLGVKSRVFGVSQCHGIVNTSPIWKPPNLIGGPNIGIKRVCNGIKYHHRKPRDSQHQHKPKAKLTASRVPG